MHTLRVWPVMIVGAVFLLLVVAVRAGAGEASSPGPATPEPEAGLQAPATGGAMECPMMAAMGGGMRMGCGGMCGKGMSSMGMSNMGMSNMGVSSMGMNHAAGPTTTLTDMAQNVSLRDILRIVQDLAAVQERMLKSLPAARAADIRPELDRLKQRSGELLTEINGMISAAAKGE